MRLSIPSEPKWSSPVIRRFFPLVVVALPILTACGEDPFLLRWEEDPREATLYSLDREELNRPSGFNMLEGRTIIVEAAHSTGRWDFAVDRIDGVLHFLPPSTLGLRNRAGIAEIPNARYEDVREAPSDTARYVQDRPVRVNPNSIYVIRTHEQAGTFGIVCVYYGRLEPLDINSADGVLRFKHDTSPDCNNRSLVPPQ